MAWLEIRGTMVNGLVLRSFLVVIPQHLAFFCIFVGVELVSNLGLTFFRSLMYDLDYRDSCTSRAHSLCYDLMPYRAPPLWGFFENINWEIKISYFFIYSHNGITCIDAQFTNMWDLVQPGIKRFATTFPSITSLFKMYLASAVYLKWAGLKWSKTLKVDQWNQMFAQMSFGEMVSSWWGSTISSSNCWE